MPSHSGTLWLSFSCARYADSRKIRPSAPQRGNGRKWLTAPMATSRSPFYSENKVTPLKLFMDHWVIVNLLENPSFAAPKDRIISLCKKGFCVLVLTIWYVHEALRDGNKVRAKDLCAKIEALSKQVPCLWIRLRTELQEDEVAEAFFRSMGVVYQKGNPFREEAVAIFPNHEKLPDIEDARREGLLWFLEINSFSVKHLVNKESIRLLRQS
jgi:hypothetical protein